MEISEDWQPIINEAINWVKEKVKPTKKELQLKISDLEEQIKTLSYGNQALSKNIEQILCLVISQLRADKQYVINADTIIMGNSGQVQVVKDDNVNNISCSKQDIGDIFDNMDEEIKECKLIRPSERGNVI